MTNPQTIEFIKQYANEDVRKLAFLAGRYPDVDMPYALDQIKGRQTARAKLPSWAEKTDIIFPPHLSMEQCSSEATGQYKARLMESFLASEIASENTIFADFTAGFGVDFSFLARLFGKAYYVEMQPHLCEIAEHNMPMLGLENVAIVNGNGEELINGIIEGQNSWLGDGVNMGQSSKRLYAFLDPARRDGAGGRTYAIGDCTPNILGFVDGLVERSQVVMVKLSPMLDWHATVADVNSATKDGDIVREVHIVSVHNECKELLLVLSDKWHSPLKVVCSDLPGDEFVFYPDSAGNHDRQRSEETEHSANSCDSVEATEYLYAPNASIMKAGCFSELENHYGIKQVSRNSHLFLAPLQIDAFPGRKFQIFAVSSLNKKELKVALKDIARANIATRNFPLSPEQLRKRLKLKDGGDTYIFATTTAKDEHVLFVCRK